MAPEASKQAPERARVPEPPEAVAPGAVAPGLERAAVEAVVAAPEWEEEAAAVVVAESERTGPFPP